MADSSMAEAVTSANYREVAEASEALLDSVRALLPASVVEHAERRVSDLEIDRHRMRCSDTTSQYVDIENVFLAAGTDEVALIDGIRSSLVLGGFRRLESVAEQRGLEQPATGAYVQVLKRPDGFGITLTRGEQPDGVRVLQLSVYSPCVANPVDRSSTWGLTSTRDR